MNQPAKPLVLITGSQGRIGRAIAAAPGAMIDMVSTMAPVAWSLSAAVP